MPHQIIVVITCTVLYSNAQVVHFFFTFKTHSNPVTLPSLFKHHVNMKTAPDMRLCMDTAWRGDVIETVLCDYRVSDSE